jgi:hypothetical protein
LQHSHDKLFVNGDIYLGIHMDDEIPTKAVQTELVRQRDQARIEHTTHEARRLHALAEDRAEDSARHALISAKKANAEVAKKTIRAPRALLNGKLSGPINASAYALFLWIIGRCRAPAGRLVMGYDNHQAILLDDYAMTEELGDWADTRGIARAAKTLADRASEIMLEYDIIERALVPAKPKPATWDKGNRWWHHTKQPVDVRQVRKATTHITPLILSCEYDRDANAIAFSLPRAVIEMIDRQREDGYARLIPLSVGSLTNVPSQRIYGWALLREKLRFRSWHIGADELAAMMGAPGVRKGAIEPMLARALSALGWNDRLQFSPIKENGKVVGYEFEWVPDRFNLCRNNGLILGRQLQDVVAQGKRKLSDTPPDREALEWKRSAKRQIARYEANKRRRKKPVETDVKLEIGMRLTAAAVTQKRTSEWMMPGERILAAKSELQYYNDNYSAALAGNPLPYPNAPLSSEFILNDPTNNVEGDTLVITRLRLDKGQPVAQVEAYLRHRMFARTVERLRRDGYDDAAAERAGRGRMEGKTEADTLLALGHKRNFGFTPEFLRMMEREATEMDEAYVPYDETF